MKIIPLGDRVLLQTKATEEKTASGLFIPQTAQEKTQIATVIAVGDELSAKIAVGNEVMYDKYAGTSVKDGGVEYLILNSAELVYATENRLAL